MKRIIKRILWRKEAEETAKFILTVVGLIAAGALVVVLLAPPEIKPLPTRPATPSVPVEAFKITTFNVVANTNPVKIEWETNKTGISTIYLWGGKMAGQVFYSLSGRCDYHWVDLDLENNTDYSYRIEVERSGLTSAKKSGTFRTSF